MSDTTVRRDTKIPPGVRRRYDPVRRISETRREEMLIARDSQRHDFVILRRIVLSEPGDWPAFEQRAQRLLFAVHPNLLPIRDYYVDARSCGVLVLEMHQGLSLEEYMRQIQTMLSPRAMIVEIVNVVLGAARGLQALHHHALLHGAVSPQAILLSGRDGFPQLTDYAMGVSRPAASTTTDLLRPPWVAPEVHPPHRLPTDPKADVYSLGATLYAMLTGSPPRPERNSPDRTPPPASKRSPHVDVGLSLVVSMMVKRDPAQRIGVSESISALECWKNSSR
jgi:serine/threonine-protein kinase